MIIAQKTLGRQALLSTTLLSSVALLTIPASASAQVAEALVASEAADAAAEPAEAILVTGSRLKRESNLESPSPIVSITAEEFRGEQDVVDALRAIPALSGSISSAQSVAPGELGSGGAVGTATLNLRGLGANRTLVLVNGRRHVAGVAETSVVDINSIPASLIKEVEVLTGGASAIYGADAVTGVVNFVLDREFDGIELGSDRRCFGRRRRREFRWLRQDRQELRRWARQRDAGGRIQPRQWSALWRPSAIS